MPRILVVLAPGAEEIETVVPADILVRAGCDVVLAAAADSVVSGSRGIPLGSHQALDAVIDAAFDLVYLPGGMGSATYCRDDARIQALIARQLASDRLLAIICASPIALVPGQHSQGRRLTSYPSQQDHLSAAGATWVDEAVVIDGNLITSQGPGTAMALGLTLVRLLCGADTATEVATAMLVDPTIALGKVCP